MYDASMRTYFQPNFKEKLVSNLLSNCSINYMVFKIELDIYLFSPLLKWETLRSSALRTKTVISGSLDAMCPGITGGNNRTIGKRRLQQREGKILLSPCAHYLSESREGLSGFDCDSVLKTCYPVLAKGPAD